MAITDKDIKKLSEVFATKEDLKKFATKDDLNRFATKDDLNRFATKDDLSNLRKDIMGGLDKISGDLEKMREDRVFAQGKDREQDRRLDNIEGRIQKVEARAG